MSEPTRADQPDQVDEAAAGGAEPDATGPYETGPERTDRDGGTPGQADGDAADEAAGPVDPGYRRFDCTGADPAGWEEAAEAARAAVEDGECIVLPTDTVYGIGADAFSAAAVQRLLDAKMRGRDMPPPVLIGDASLIRALATDVPDQARELVERHWPGPLTVICRIQPSLRMDLGDAEGTIALRVPDHALARAVLRRTGPMAVSSANLSGMPAALSCDDAVGQLAESVAVYLDGGTLDATGGAPSTIVDFTQSEDGEVLRLGALSLTVLRETLPDVVDLTESAEPAAAEPDAEVEPDAEAPEGGTEPASAADPHPAEPVGARSEQVEPVETQPEPEPGAPPSEADAVKAAIRRATEQTAPERPPGG